MEKCDSICNEVSTLERNTLRYCYNILGRNVITSRAAIRGASRRREAVPSGTVRHHRCRLANCKMFGIPTISTRYNIHFQNSVFPYSLRVILKFLWQPCQGVLMICFISFLPIARSIVVCTVVGGDVLYVYFKRWAYSMTHDTNIISKSNDS